MSHNVPAGTEGGSVSWTTKRELEPGWAEVWEDWDETVEGLIEDWDEVVVGPVAGEAPARSEAAAIMAIDRTRPAMPYLMLRALIDMFGGGYLRSDVNPTVLNVCQRWI